MKIKTLSITLLLLSTPLIFARVSYPVFRTQTPSILVKPQSKYFSALLNLEPRFTYLLKESPQQTSWIDLNLISSYEISPFSIQNLNVGVQKTLGSSGLILHAVGKWIPFPEYKYQPTIGFFVDAYNGFSPQKQFLFGSNIQLLIHKNFMTRNRTLKNWGIYLAPLLRLENLEPPISNLYWIAGLNFNFDTTPNFYPQWSLNLEGHYNQSFFEFGLRFLLYIK